MKLKNDYRGMTIYLCISFFTVLFLIITVFYMHMDMEEEIEYLSLSKRGYTLTFSEFVENYPEAEIRETADRKIAYLKSPLGRNLYLMFKYNDYLETYTALSQASWYYKKPLYSEDFDSLIIGKSTLEDVLEIDEYGKVYTEFGDTRNIPVSVHHTQDKKDVVIYYQKANLINYLANNGYNISTFRMDVRDCSEFYPTYWTYLFEG
ncbi:MAG: hypothetical protein LUD81_03460 [Clostridiales bacterium]|nr:hypothetical protein [Clostridiales bacterium]